MHEILTPGVEHGEETDLRAQVLGIGRDRAQRLTRRSEKYIVDMLFVLKGDGGNRLRYRKDYMKIADRQKLSLTIVEPFGLGHRLAFVAMPIAATVIRNALVVTLITLLDVTTKCCGSTQLDRGHDATLFGG